MTDGLPDAEVLRVIFGKRPKNAVPMASKMTDRIWPLQGLARCKICGSALTGSCSIGSRGKVRYFYLRCSGKQQRVQKTCTASLLPATTWEQGVVDSLVWLADHEEGPG